MNTFSHVPPGFRFHPTDEELVDYYLRKKVNSRRIDLDVIKDVDLYKIEPWDLQEICGIGGEEQDEWYFFSHKDKKYPTGTRTNRATTAGFWKATGRDKAIYLRRDLIGMRKTLVFYKGRAPNGQKSDWIMHEYRLETDENGTPQEEGWVVCRVFKKRMATMRKVMSEHETGIWFDDHEVQFMHDLDSPKQQRQPDHLSYHHQHHHDHHLPYSCKKELHDLHHQYHQVPGHDRFLHLPLLQQNPKAFLQTPLPNSVTQYGLDINQQATTLQSSSLTREEHVPQARDQGLLSVYDNHNNTNNNNSNDQSVDQVTDWRVLDKFVASQLSQEDDVAKENNDYSNNASGNVVFESSSDQTNVLVRILNKKQEPQENASASTSSCQIDLWK